MRIALTYFSFLPLQRWLNWIGVTIWLCATLAGIALIAISPSSPQRFDNGMLLMIAGSMFAVGLIILTPAFVGGGALRFASAPGILHLRPHGRWRMLLGATLAITLIAALVTLPTLFLLISNWRHAARTSSFTPLDALVTFEIAWSSTALLWIVVFITSRIQLLCMISIIVLVPIVQFAAALLTTLSITNGQLANMLSAIAVVAWTAFGIWYLNTQTVRNTSWVTSLLNAPSNGRSFKFAIWSTDAAGDTPTSLPVALRNYLAGAGSPWHTAGVSLIMAVLVLCVFHWLSAGKQQHLPTFILMLFTIFSAAGAPRLVRRTRLLWLRAGLDRAALFTLAERHTLIHAAAMLSVITFTLVVPSLAVRPDLTDVILLFAATQIAAAPCFIYAGLAATRSGDWRPTALHFGLFALCLISVIYLQPESRSLIAGYVVALITFGTLTLLLRWYARRQWLKLDWRAAGTPLLDQRLR